jgi:hypothetical protein
MKIMRTMCGGEVSPMDIKDCRVLYLTASESDKSVPSASSKSDYKKCPMCGCRNIESIGRGAYGCPACSHVWGHFS